MSRKLDVAIAEALGYKADDVNCPLYSTDGNAMLLLGKEMRALEWVFSVAETVTKLIPKQFVAYYETRDSLADGVADTEPLARALAAYKALTGKGWRGVT